MSPENFCVFILTHGRPDNVITINTLKKHGYTGPVFLIIDDEDATADKYYENYGEQVIMFSKEEIAQTFDEGDNFDDRRAIIYARNACFSIANRLGFTYFIELDDDYTTFSYKYTPDGVFKTKPIKGLDSIFSSLLEYYKSIPALSIAMAQGGDFLGGDDGNFAYSHRRRKAMNTFVCSIDRPFNFFGRINEDVNTYTNLGSRGGFFMTIPNIAINQKTSQSNKGGMTDIYIDSGTYIKSFYTIMYQPSSVKIKMMQSNHPRLHHKVSWRNTVPMILSEKYKATA